MPTVLVKSFLPNENEQNFEVNSGLILFDELERLGLVLPHGCLAGSCGSCKIEILEGAENLSEPGLVELDTISSVKSNFPGSSNIRMSCRAKVLGNVTIRVLK